MMNWLEWYLRAGRASRTAPWLFSATLALFSLSFLFVDSSGTKSTFFYVACAFPALLLSACHLGTLSRSTEIRALFVFLVLYCATLLAIDGPSPAPLKQSLYIMLLLVGLFVASRDQSGMRVAAFCFSIASSAVGLYAIGLWVAELATTGVPSRMTLSGAMENPVHAALLVLTGWLGLCFIKLLPECRARGVGYLVAGYSLMLAYSALVILAFQARSALLGLVLAVLTYVFFQRERAIAVIASLGLLFLLLTSGLGETLLARGLSYRLDIWQEAWLRLIHDCSWLAGCGRSTRHLYLDQFFHAHSGYLSIFVENGLIGLSAFILFSLLFFRRGFRTKSPWFALALLGWGSLITTSYGIVTKPISLWIYFWIPTLIFLIEALDADASRKTRVIAEDEPTRR